MAKNNELIAAAKSAISDVLNIEQIVLILIAHSKDYRTDHNYLASRSLQPNPLSYLSQQNDQCNGCLQWFKGSDSWLRHIRNCTDINTHRRNNRWRKEKEKMFLCIIANCDHHQQSLCFLFGADYSDGATYFYYISRINLGTKRSLNSHHQ